MECIFISAVYIKAHHIFLHYNLSFKKQSVASHLWTDGECFGKFISHVGRQRPGTRQGWLPEEQSATVADWWCIPDHNYEM